MIVQIYGITTPGDARASAELGAQRIGVVVCEDESITPDGNSIEQAREIMAAIPPRVTVCALTFSTDIDEIEDMLGELNPDVLHLSKSTDLLPLADVRKLRKRVPDLKIMQAIPVDGPEAIEQAMVFEEIAETILLDTGAPDKIGATGRTHDWGISREIVDRATVPVILAGGLSPENVADAIRAVRPWGVDSFTLTSRPDDLKVKDLELVRQFIDAAKQAI